MRKPILLVTLLAAFSVAVFSGPTAPSVPPAAAASAHFDARAATDAWLASVPAAQRAK